MSKFLVILFLISSTYSFGQTRKTSFGISSSLDLNSYMLVDDLGEIGDFISYKGRLSYSVGIMVNFKISEKIYLRSGASYSNKSFTEIIEFSNNPDDPVLRNDDEIKVIYTNQFIDVPIDIHYTLNASDRKDIYLLLGLVNSFRIGFKKEVEKDFAGSDSRGIKYNKYLLSTKLGFGYQLNRGKVGIAFEPQLRLYLTEVHERFITENPVYFGLEVNVLKLK